MKNPQAVAEGQTPSRQVGADASTDPRWEALEAKVGLTRTELSWAGIREASRTCLPGGDDGDGCGNDVIHDGLAVPLVDPLTGEKVSEQVWLGHLSEAKDQTRRHKPLTASCAPGTLSEHTATFGSLDGRRAAIICEGITDWLTLTVAVREHGDEGDWAVLGLPGVGSAKGLVARLCGNAEADVESVIAAFDADDAGRGATAEARLAWTSSTWGRCFTAVAGLTEGTDLTDHASRHGRPALMQLIDGSPLETKPRLLGLTRDHVLREMDRHDIGLRLNVRNGKYEWRNGGSDNDTDHKWGDCPKEAEAEIRRLLTAEATWDERTRIQPTPFEEIKLQIGHCTRTDPWLDHLKSLPPWDGIPRVKTLFSRLWTLADGDDVAVCAAEAATSLIWGAVLRTFHPGAEHDEVAVLISEKQGFGKSKFGKWLFPPELSGDCFTDGVKLNALGTLAERDMMAGLVGRVLIELADLAGIRKADLQTVNGWITQTADELSLKWRHTQSFPAGS